MSTIQPKVRKVPVFDHDDLRLSPAEKIINTWFNDALNCKLITLPVKLAKLKEKKLLTYSPTSFFY